MTNGFGKFCFGLLETIFAEAVLLVVFCTRTLGLLLMLVDSQRCDSVSSRYPRGKYPLQGRSGFLMIGSVCDVHRLARHIERQWERKRV